MRTTKDSRRRVGTVAELGARPWGDAEFDPGEAVMFASAGGNRRLSPPPVAGAPKHSHQRTGIRATAVMSAFGRRYPTWCTLRGSLGVAPSGHDAIVDAPGHGRRPGRRDLAGEGFDRTRPRRKTELDVADGRRDRRTVRAGDAGRTLAS